MKSSTRILRNILSELRQTSPSSRPLNGQPIVKDLLGQFRQNVVTDGQTCRRVDELQFMANTYQCYLRSLRSVREIKQKFCGSGERSVPQTADLIGFKLPETPKH